LRGVSLLLAGLVCVTSPVCFAAPNPRSSPQPTVSPSPTPTSPAAPNKCCFCISPPSDTPDARRFFNECLACLPQKFPGCDTYRSFPADEYREDVVRELGCVGRVNIVNNQHGPDLSRAQDIIRVCTSAYPTCNIGLVDLSCGSYTNEFSAQAALMDIQRSLGGRVSVDICGSGSNNLVVNCTTTRITKTYVVSPSVITSDLGLCPEFGALCSNVGERFKCKDTLNRSFTIPCCKVEGQTTIGYWGNGGGCDGRGCTTQRCPNRNFCSGTVVTAQACSSISPTGVCVRTALDCSIYGQVCGKENGDVRCIQPPTPRASPSPSPSPSR
jgi:hypothetical protein